MQLLPIRTSFTPAPPSPVHIQFRDDGGGTALTGIPCGIKRTHLSRPRPLVSQPHCGPSALASHCWWGQDPRDAKKESSRWTPPRRAPAPQARQVAVRTPLPPGSHHPVSCRGCSAHTRPRHACLASPPANSRREPRPGNFAHVVGVEGAI